MKTQIRSCALVLFLCVAILFSCGKEDSLTPQGGTPTAVGIPIGASNSATIDATGGTIFSTDGRLEIIIPPNALITSTKITIQPVTNTTPGGAGEGYDLSPDGQQFALPITLRFHYDSLDMEGTSFLAFGIAYQKKDHVWSSFNSAVVDSIAGTESITTSHFTVHNLYRRIYVIPVSAKIDVGNTIALKVQQVTFVPDPNQDPNQDDQLIAGLVDFTRPAQIMWFVNGNAGGNSNDGTISPVSNSFTTTYTAPSTTVNMSSNPVAVRARLSGIPGAAALKLYLNSSIKVRSSYFVQIGFSGTQIPAYACHFNYNDYATFHFTINSDNSFNISQINNTSGELDSIVVQDGYPCSIKTNGGDGELLNVSGLSGAAQDDELLLVILSTGTMPEFVHTCPPSTEFSFPSTDYVGAFDMPLIPLDGHQHTVMNNSNPTILITVRAIPE